MKLDVVANSNNDEFYTPFYAIEPLLKYVDIDRIVWCPFDTEKSLIVKTFQNRGNEVIYTHLSEDKDFFVIDPPGCDVIISNPPYSQKGKVFERLFTIDIDFAMLVGVVGLFESQHRFELFAKNKFEIMWLNKRISYFKSYEDEKPSLNPPFSSVWITKNLLPQQNNFERINK